MLGCPQPETATEASSDSAAAASTSGSGETADDMGSTSAATTDDSTTQGVATTDEGGVCGDGVTDPGEACDDGNAANADGCNRDCIVSGSTLFDVTLEAAGRAVAVDDAQQIDVAMVLGPWTVRIVRRASNGIVGIEDYPAPAGAVDVVIGGLARDGDGRRLFAARWLGDDPLGLIEARADERSGSFEISGAEVPAFFFALASDASLIGIGHTEQQAAVLRYALDGTLVSSAPYSGPFPRAVDAWAPDRIAVAGRSGTTATMQGISSAGAELWSTTHTWGDVTFGEAVAESMDGTMLFGGGAFTADSTQAWLARASTEGVVLELLEWSDETVSGIAVDGVGHVVVAGTSSLRKLDPTLQPLWERELGSVRALDVAADGHIAVAYRTAPGTEALALLAP